MSKYDCDSLSEVKLIRFINLVVAMYANEWLNQKLSKSSVIHLID